MIAIRISMRYVRGTRVIPCEKCGCPDALDKKRFIPTCRECGQKLLTKPGLLLLLIIFSALLAWECLGAFSSGTTSLSR